MRGDTFAAVDGAVDEVVKRLKIKSRVMYPPVKLTSEEILFELATVG